MQTSDKDDAAAAGMQTEALPRQPTLRCSRFTFRNLADMAAATPTAPLRVIAHIDLDAYYAQCEMLRLGTADDTPLAVQQWRNIIAVNYPARAFGVSRMITAQEARKLCPRLVLQHVPTWKEGETQWAYHADAADAMAHHKASLEPYRIRSRAILATIRDALPPGGRCRLEKAGIDEVFVDLSACVHDRLVQRYPDLLAAADADQAGTEALPLPPLTEEALQEGLSSTGSGVVDGDEAGTGTEGENEGDADTDVDADSTTVSLDWDDVALLEGARIVHAVRQVLRTKLRFRCSAGIACNKMLSKLGSSQHKPDRQTVVRPRAAATFLASLKSVTQMRGLGGKTGARLVEVFDTKAVAELRTVSLAQLQAKLGDAETAHHIYWMLRGVDHSEVRARTEVQSILSAKAFNPPLQAADYDKAVRWLRVFAAELKCRLLDERLSQALLDEATVPDGRSDSTAAAAVLPSEEAAIADHQQQQQLIKRLPQRIRLQFAVSGAGNNYRGQKWRSRQMRIPRDGTPLDETKLHRLGVQLLDAAQSDRLWPCAHLAIALDGFEEHAKGNQNIASFFQPKAGAPSPPSKDTALSDNDNDDATTEKGNGINSDDGGSDHADDDAALGVDALGPLAKRRRQDDDPAAAARPKAAAPDSSRRGGMHAFGFLASSSNVSSRGSPAAERGPHACGRCSRSFASAVQLQEHLDWHVARSLQAQSLARPGPTTVPGAPAANNRRPAVALPISSFFTSRAASPARDKKGSVAIGKENGGNRAKGGDQDSAPAMRPPLVCRRCAASFAGPAAMQIHEDWHLAKDLDGG